MSAWSCRDDPVGEVGRVAEVLIDELLEAGERSRRCVRALDRVVTPLMTVHWIDDDLHRTAVASLLVSDRRKLSLVDTVSFETMRRFHLGTAFTLDRHFAEQGFAILP